MEGKGRWKLAKSLGIFVAHPMPVQPNAANLSNLLNFYDYLAHRSCQPSCFHQASPTNRATKLQIYPSIIPPHFFLDKRQYS